MNYTLHQLRVFLKVSELKSITKAAEELHLTQPAVSIQLKRLQEQFEIPLTEVIGRQLYITEFGEKIAEASSKIIEEADSMKELIDHHKGLLSGKIRISSASTGKYVIPYFLTEYMREHTQVDISIDVTNKQRVLESLQDNDTDFALISVVPDSLNVEKIELMHNQLVLVGSNKLPIIEKDQVKPSDLREVPLIFREQGSATRKAMEEYLMKNNIAPKRSMELVSNEAVKQAVNAGLGLSILPLIGIKKELITGALKVYKIKGLPITTRWYLVYNKGKKLSPAAKALVSHIEENKHNVFDRQFRWVKDWV